MGAIFTKPTLVNGTAYHPGDAVPVVGVFRGVVGQGGCKGGDIGGDFVLPCLVRGAIGQDFDR